MQDTTNKYIWAPDNTQGDPDLETSPYTQHAMILCNTDDITIEELDMAIKQPKRNKAPGPDGTTAELYKWPDQNNRAPRHN